MNGFKTRTEKINGVKVDLLVSESRADFNDLAKLIRKAVKRRL